MVDKSGIDHPTFLAELIEFIVVFRSDGFVAYQCSERDWSIGLSSKSVLVRFHAIGHFVQHVPQVARTFRRTVTLFFWETALNRGRGCSFFYSSNSPLNDTVGLCAMESTCIMRPIRILARIDALFGRVSMSPSRILVRSHTSQQTRRGFHGIFVFRRKGVANQSTRPI